MKNISILITVFLLSTLLVHAQKEYFVKATIVKPGGDTLAGYIQRVRDNMLADSIIFKPDINSKETQHFAPDDLAGFTLLNEKEKYEPITYELYDKTGNPVIQKRFASLLLKGYCSLYELELKDDELHIIFEPGNTHLFLAKKGGVVTVLSETENMVDDKYQLNKKYLESLESLFSDCTDIDAELIAKTQFFKKDLIKIFTSYNLCRFPKVKPEVYNSRKELKLNTAIYIGYPYATYHGSTNFSGFTTGFFVELLRPGANERISFTAGLELRTFKVNFASGDSINNNSGATKGTAYALPLKATYYFNKRKVAPFFRFGVVPTLQTVNPYSDNGNFASTKGWIILGSFGPGVLIGKIYTEFLIEKDAIISLGRGTFYSLRVGVLL